MNFEDYLAEQGYEGNTLDKYRRALILFSLEIKNTRKVSVMEMRSWLDGHGWGSSARWVSWCAVKGYLRWLCGEDHPALKLKIKRQEAGPQRSLNMNAVKQLLGSFDTMTARGVRDLAICTLALDSGLRSSEICRLELKSLSILDRHLMVIIKGGRWGEGVFSTETARYLDNWITIRSQFALEGTRTVFVSIGGDTRGKPLTRDGLGCVVSSWASKAGIDVLSPHDLRRTFAVLATRLHAPARVLQVAGRWSNISMVERYTQAISAEDFEPYFPVAGAMN